LQYVFAGYVTNNNPISINFGRVTVYSNLVSALAVWPDTGAYSLQTNHDLRTTNWIRYGGSITSTNGTNSAVITTLGRNLFFRLSKP
jgi:hypothetical protein